jgi:hypothetical protein
MGVVKESANIQENGAKLSFSLAGGEWQVLSTEWMNRRFGRVDHVRAFLLSHHATEKLCESAYAILGLCLPCIQFPTLHTVFNIHTHTES